MQYCGCYIENADVIHLYTLFKVRATGDENALGSVFGTPPLWLLKDVFISDAAPYVGMWILVNDNARSFKQEISLINIFSLIYVPCDFQVGGRIGQFLQFIN